MKLYIREHVFTWGDEFTVWDSDGNEKYFVQGEVFTWGKKLHIYDRAHREVAYIEQELLTFFPRYHVYLNGRDVAQVCREFAFFHPSYRVDGPGWQVDGEFLGHSYTVTSGNRRVVSIEKEWMTWGDCYELDIADPADEILALAVVITIDCVDESNNN